MPDTHPIEARAPVGDDSIVRGLVMVGLVLAAACDVGANAPATDGGHGGGDAATGGGDATGGGSDAPMAAVDARNDEPPGLSGITALHNQVRAMVGVAPLTWDPDLAAVAQAWADQCVDVEIPIGLIDHNAGRSDNYPGYVGENVYGSGGTATPSGAVSLWAAEEANYDYASNTCAQGKVCGHYTQLVWSTTQRLGCGLSSCPGLTYGSTIVCDYSPGGNNGSRPY